MAMGDFLTALGLLFVIEGVLYAMFPEGMQRMMQQAIGLAPSMLRNGGVIAMIFGFLVVWLVRG